MCLTCGCHQAVNSHGDGRNITLADLASAADAAGIDLDTAVQNLVDTVAEVTEPAGPMEPTPVAKGIHVIPDAKRFVFGVAYPANRPDGHDEFMRPEEVERVAWDYARNHRRVGFFHADGTEGHADVVESSIYRGPTYVVKDINGADQEIRTGDWLLGAILDEVSWGLVTTGRATGWSIDGAMKRRTVPRSAI